MTKRLKLKRINEVKTLLNVIDGLEKNASEKTNDFFEYGKDAILELACGQGTYTIELAKLNPNKLYMGIDIQGERLWYGAKQALESNLNNVVFLRAPIETLLDYIPEKLISEIWITFPDPFPSEGKSKKRLTNKRYLEIYKMLLKAKGLVHLKTDDIDLFEYSLVSFKEEGYIKKEALKNIHSIENLNSNLKIITPYEKRHIINSKMIYYASFQLS